MLRKNNIIEKMRGMFHESECQAYEIHEYGIGVFPKENIVTLACTQNLETLILRLLR
jgi:hypothetical protein